MKQRRQSLEANGIVLSGAVFVCTRCAEAKPAKAFGLRRMGNGQVRNQSQCTACRSKPARAGVSDNFLKAKLEHERMLREHDGLETWMPRAEQSQRETFFGAPPSEPVRLDDAVWNVIRGEASDAERGVVHALGEQLFGVDRTMYVARLDIGVTAPTRVQRARRWLARSVWNAGDCVHAKLEALGERIWGDA